VTFGLPVVDTLLAMVRRTLRGEKITQSDRGHIHHRLRDLGHSPRKVAVILYAICGLSGLLSLLFLSDNGGLVGLAFLVTGIAMWFGIQRLRIPELLEARRAIDVGMQQRHLIARNLAIRDGARRLRFTGDMAELFRELDGLCTRSGFEQVEIWLSPEVVGTAGPHLASELRLVDSGYVWRWRNVPFADTDPKLCWELRLPMLSEAGEEAGRFSIRRKIGSHVPGDVGIIARELLPEIVQAIDRFAVRVEAGPDEGPIQARVGGL
jgi:hypothetical protein